MKILVTPWVFIALATSMSFAAQATHQGQTRHAQKLIQQFDSNQDGQLTLDEVQARRDATFTQIDANQDHMLSLEEFAQLPQIRKKTRFGEIDINQDASISLDELITHRQNRFNKVFKEATHQKLQQRFKKADANNDNLLNFEEFIDFSKPSKTSHSRTEAHFTRLDKDQNGLISRSEFVTQVRLFDRFDCNEDGLLTQEELHKKPCLK